MYPFKHYLAENRFGLTEHTINTYLSFDIEVPSILKPIKPNLLKDAQPEYYIEYAKLLSKWKEDMNEYEKSCLEYQQILKDKKKSVDSYLLELVHDLVPECCYGECAVYINEAGNYSNSLIRLHNLKEIFGH